MSAVELTKDQENYIDSIVKAIITGSMTRDGILNVDRFRGVVESAYRAAFVSLETKKQYIKETVKEVEQSEVKQLGVSYENEEFNLDTLKALKSALDYEISKLTEKESAAPVAPVAVVTAQSKAKKVKSKTKKTKKKTKKASKKSSVSVKPLGSVEKPQNSLHV